MAGVIIKFTVTMARYIYLELAYTDWLIHRNYYVDPLTQLIERDDECAERRDVAPCF